MTNKFQHYFGRFAHAFKSNTHDYTYAGFALRMSAAIIDLIFIAIILVPIMGFLEHLLGLRDGLEQAQAVLQHGIYSSSDILLVISARFPSLLFECCFISITILLCWVFWQATPGKLLLGMRILDYNTQQAPTVLQYLKRLIGYFVSILPLGLGFLLIASTKRKHRAWHDTLSGTYVRNIHRSPLAASPDLTTKKTKNG